MGYGIDRSISYLISTRLTNPTSYGFCRTLEIVVLKIVRVSPWVFIIPRKGTRSPAPPPPPLSPPFLRGGFFTGEAPAAVSRRQSGGGPRRRGYSCYAAAALHWSATLP